MTCRARRNLLTSWLSAVDISISLENHILPRYSRILVKLLSFGFSARFLNMPKQTLDNAASEASAKIFS